MSDPKPSPTKPSKNRRMFRYFSYSLVALVLTIFCLPWILSSTPLRHSVVTGVIDNPRLSATVEEASFGWFSPLKLEELEILRDDSRLRVTVNRFEAEKSWLQLALGAPNLGTLELDEPVVEAVLGEGWKPPADDPDKKEKKRTLLSAVVRSAGFKLRSPELAKPVVDLDGISTTVDIKPDGDGRLLTIAPVRVFDHEELTPELCGKGLHLVAPILGDATRVEGEISFAMDRFQLPLDSNDKELIAKKTDIRGIVELHSVEAGLKNPLLAGLVGMVSKISGLDIPSDISIAEDTQVAFHVLDGRVYHEGMTFMLPELSSELAIQTSGSVGFDETLDLQVVIPIPGDILRDNPLVQRMAGKPLHLRVTGTLEEPKFGLDKTAGLLAGVSGLIMRGDGDGNAEGGEIADSIVDLVGGFLGGNRQGDAPPVGDMLERLRERREEARKKREAERTAAPPRRGGLFRRRDREQP